MTPHELATHCKASVESPCSAGKVTLVVPGSPRGHRIRLDRTSRRKCPMGVVVNWQADPPRTVALFDAIEVLAWLHAEGLVEVGVKVREHDNG